MNNEDSLKLSMIKEEIFDPKSDLYLDNLLDLAASISYDIHCSGTWKNSKPIKSFLQRFSNFSDKILQLRVSLNDFSIIKTVGQGGFGRVDLVKHKQSKNIYAMKVMDKSTFVQNSFNGFWEERDIMAKNDSDWLIKCFYTFMDMKRLYIVMEYMPGGDLYHWMMTLEEFSDEQTHFYAMEMVLAVEILHEMGFIHRDLKPDNMLLDRNGHLKLADFGTCIRVGRNGKVRTNFQVGTPDYISPEILRNTGVHDLEVGFEIDWWAFGVVLYELFYGETPFEGESTSTLYRNIMCYKSTLVYPDDKPARPEFQEFLSRVLTEPEERMGVRDIKQHPYLNGPGGPYKWTFATIREHQSPVIFEVAGDDDTNFINYDPADKRNQNLASIPNSNNYFSGENIAFSGFTFNRLGKYGELLAAGGTGGAESGQSDARISELEVQRQQIAIKYDAALSELGKAQAAAARLEKELADKEQWIGAKRAEIATAQDSGKASKTKIDGLTKQLESVQREVDQLKTALVERDGQIRALKLEQANLAEEAATSQAEAQARLEKAEKMGKKLEEKTAEIARLEQLEPLLEQEKARAEGLVIELNSKLRKITELESRLEMASTNATTTSSISGDLERLKKEKDELESRLAESTSQLGVLERDVANERRKREDLAKSRDKLVKEVAAQKTQVGSLQSKLMSSEDQKKLLRRRINALESEKDVIDQEKRMSDSIIAMKNTEIESITAELEEKCELFDRIRSELEHEKAILESQHRALSIEHQTTCCESAERARKLEEMQVAALEHGLVAQRLDRALHELGLQRAVAMDLAATGDQLRADLERATKLNASDKTKIASLVSKIDELVKNPKMMSQTAWRSHKKKDINTAEFQKKIRLLESDLQKERQKTHEKTLECNEARNECQQLQDVIRELRLDLDKKQTIINEMMRANISVPASELTNRTPGGTTSDRQPPSTATAPLEVMFSPGQTALQGTELQTLTGQIDMLKKGKGRHKHVWLASYAVLRPFRLEIFQNESGSDVGTPVVSIDLRSVIHVTEPSPAEWVHVDKATLPRTLQIIYEKPDASDDSRRHSVASNVVPGSTGLGRQMTHDELWHGPSSRSSTLQHDGTSSGPGASFSSNTLSSLPANGIFNIENHSFVPMRFRSFTKCDVCQLQCSDMINPPPSLECSKCKKKIHLDHIHANEKIQWCQGAFAVLLIRTDTREAKAVWMSCINKLKTSQKANEIQVSPSTFYRSVRQSTAYSPGNLNIP